MKEVLIDTLLDGIKLLPFLLLAFLIIELIEHKLSKRTKEVISKSGRVGPLFGSLLGLVPQCGFSVMATNLYVTRMISLGTLISIYLSTSDEMLPVLLSQNVSWDKIFGLLLTKWLVGMFFGFLIDFLLRKRSRPKEDYHICKDEDCDCEHGLLLPVLKHTLHTGIFIFVATLLLNSAIHYLGEENITHIFLKNSLLAPFVASLLGLVPNCAASVILTELYLKEAITFGGAIAGLLTGSGVALLVLFRSNRNWKENITILSLIYIIGGGTGFLIEVVSRWLF